MPLSKQSQDSGSLYGHFRELIRLRNSIPALSNGDIESIDLGSKAVVAYKRQGQGRSLLVVHNVSEHDCEINLPEGVRHFTKMIYSSVSESELASGKLVLEPYAAIIIGHRGPQ